MGFFKNVGRGTKRAFGYNEIKDNTGYVKNTVKSFMAVGGMGSTGERYEKFEDMPFNEKQIQATYQSLKKLAITYISIVALAMLYVLYNLVDHNYLTALLSLCFGSACLSMAYRYHFWMMQIKKRKLSCSFSEYLDFLLHHKD